MFNSTVKYLMVSLIFCTENNTYRGNWTTEGCKLNIGKSNIISGQFICECTHLTNFAVIVVSLAIKYFISIDSCKYINTCVHITFQLILLLYY